jgi:hypothetical protein
VNFANALQRESAKTYTENGATAINTTGNALVDLFGCIGALREADDTRIERLFADAYATDALLATKMLFYARDIRQGLGERDTVRTLLRYVANMHPEALRPNIKLIPFYGRYDDLYALVGTKLENDAFALINEQLDLDVAAYDAKKPYSLLAKWLKSPYTSSKKSVALARLTAKRTHMSIPEYRKTLAMLRRGLDVVEQKTSSNRWDEIAYARVPSGAMHRYARAFSRHDAVRFGEYLDDVAKGKKTIHAATLYPYDIIRRVMRNDYDKALEAQWNALPNYVTGDNNVLVIADTSGSMDGRPLYTAVGLAIYFAERNHGPYHNLWMSFSSDSKVQRLKGETLLQKVESIDKDHWSFNTNLKAAFEHILTIAKDNKVAPEDMVTSLVIISDMEIDRCTGESWLFYDEMAKRFRDAGYTIPNIVFWNVDSRHDIFHADHKRAGVQLCSGQSASTFKTLMASIDMTPEQMMRKVLDDKRYEPITIGEC